MLLYKDEPRHSYTINFMKIPNYISTEEKRKVFPYGYCMINTPTEFDEWYKKISSSKINLHRGVHEAYYKNFSSVQRMAFINEIEDPHKLLTKEISQLRCSNEHLHEKFCNSLDVSCSDMYLMSFAQHYGGISPLIDFSYSLDKALYFMIDDVKYPSQGASTGSFENYMSLYSLIYDEGLENDLFTLIEQYKNTDFCDEKYIANASAILKQTIMSSKLVNKLSPLAFVNGAFWNLDIPLKMTLEEKEKKRISFGDIDSYEGGILYIISELQPLLICNDIKSFEICGHKGTLGTLICNLNEVAQESCFIYHDKKFEPLEHQLRCTDIHKSLAPYIKKKYLTNYTCEDIYPNPKDMVAQSLFDALAFCK